MPAYFSTIKNGYNPEEVDKHINNLEAIINEYKQKDSSISNAIVNAQIAADRIIKNSELAAEEIRKNALDQLDKIADSVEKQRQIVTEFQDEYNELMSKYVKKANAEDFKSIFSQIDTLDKYFDSLKQSKTPTTPQAATPQKLPVEGATAAQVNP